MSIFTIGKAKSARCAKALAPCRGLFSASKTTKKRNETNMEYTKEKADAVAKQHDIDEKTLRTWKKRNKIPDRYFDINGEVRQDDLSKLGDAQTYNMLRFYEEVGDHLNWVNMRVKGGRFLNVKEGKAVFRETEYIDLKKDIADIKKVCGALIRAETHEARFRAVQKVFEDKRIHPFTLGEIETIRKIRQGKIGSIAVSSKELNEIRRNILLIFQINME